MNFSGCYPNGFIQIPFSGIEQNFTIWPWHVGDAYYEISGIERIIGLNPLNGYSSLTARISGIESGYLNLSGGIITGGIIPATSGTIDLGTSNLPFSGVYTDSINDVPIYTTAYFVKPHGAIDGSNDTFTLANIPVGGLVFVFENGIRLTPSGSHGYDFDYYLSGNAVIFSSAPVSGSKVLVDYTY